ncbi:Putative LOC100197594 [Caligus rogercresseyi]|uniref:LOC100197594 n=1 Tax=Caligus rogercresseyi TaxID=217165 RepID=A0A7T8K966_CALRO|nr:Putative LOC100197594 [Caligus rogercresseyi]
MVFGAVASDGSLMPHFVEAGLKINTVEYVHILEEVFFSWMDEKFGLDNVVLIQDSHHAMGPRPQDLVGQESSQFREGLKLAL